MKRLLVLYLTLITVVAYTNYDDFNKLSTIDEFTTYSTKDGVTPSYKATAAVYADAMNNQENYKTFQNFLDKFDSIKADYTEDGKVAYAYPLVLHCRETSSSTPLLSALGDEVLAVVKEDYPQWLAYLYINNPYCQRCNISAEERFSQLTYTLCKYTNISTYLLNEQLTVLVALAPEIDDDIVIKSFTKIYRRYYPLYQNDADKYKSFITTVKSVLESYK